MNFIIRLIATMAGLWVAGAIIGNIVIGQGADTLGTIFIYATIALILTLVNSIVRPIAKVVAFPLYILTLGLFGVIVNTLTFMLASWVSSTMGVPFVVDGFLAAFLGAIIVSVVSTAVSGLLTKND